jgi:hypothetical protein
MANCRAPPHILSSGGTDVARYEKAFIMSFKSFSTTHHDAASPHTGAAKAAPVKPAQAAQAAKDAKQGQASAAPKS